MANNLKTEFIWGKDLTSKDFNLINAKRTEIFGKTPWNYESNNFFLERLFSVLKLNEDILAFAMLIPVELHIDENKYSIWGISTVASVEPGKGFGKMLMNAVKNFANKDNKIIVGSCVAKNTEFYRKCGYEIWEEGQKYFVYATDQGQEQLDEEGVIYFYLDQQDIIKNARNSNKMIYHYFPHW